MPHFLRGTATSWRLDHGLIAAGLALCVAIAGVTGWLALMQKHRGIDGEAQNLERLSLVVADHVDRSFRSIDALHGSIVQSLPADAVRSPAAFAAFAARPDTAALLDQRRQGLGFLDDLVLLDAGGRVLASAQAGSGKPAPGAAPFATLLQTPTRGAATSGPVRDGSSRDPRAWESYRLEKIRDPQGVLIGAVASGIRLGYFEALFNAIRGDGGHAIGLYRKDGELMVRAPLADAMLGRKFDLPSLRTPYPEPAERIVPAGIAPDGEERLWSAQDLREPGFQVVSSVPTRQIAAAWRSNILPLALLWLIALVGVGVCALGMRQLRIQDGLSAQARHDARHDELTGLPNRMLFIEELHRLSEPTGPIGASAVLLLDLDNFKNINDTLGHPAGDVLLRTIGARLRQTIRKHDLVARLGGDEFAVLQRDIASKAEAHALAKRLAQAVNVPCELEGYDASTQVSIGITFLPADGTSPDTLLMNAELALYSAKAEGRATWNEFAPHMAAQVESRRAIEDALRNALQNDGFTLHFQPIVSAADCEPRGFEALLRWKRPEENPWTLEQFIPVAEDTGLIVPIGQWVLETVCEEAHRWQDHLHFAANVSARQFSERELVVNIVRLVLQHGLAPRQLALEITETVLLQKTEAIKRALHELREFGVSIALDDFGTGYASLSHLLQFPTDSIKIDRSFVADMESSPEAERIVRTLLELGSHLGLTVTAEGVETTAQRDFLSANGCTELQGYLFGRPMPAEELRTRFAALLRPISPITLPA